MSHPILYNALRYSVNTTEYATIYRRTPKPLQRRALDPQKYEQAARSRDDYHAASVRAAVRVFITTQSGLKLWEFIQDSIGASLSGAALGIFPASQLRLTMAIYVAARSLEFLYNALEKQGRFSKQPKWMGSWLFFPLSFGQLLHAFVFDRDCFPTEFGDFIMKYTPEYIQRRPANAPPTLVWPSRNEIVDALAAMANLKWPAFTSPILHPKNPSPLPPTIPQSISPITSRAHASHTYLSCALIHPSTPSCLQAAISHFLLSTPQLARLFLLFTPLFAIPRILRSPSRLSSSPTIIAKVLSNAIIPLTLFVSLAITTSWSSICLAQTLLPRHVFPRFRFFLGGFAGGMAGLILRGGSQEKGNALYMARLSADSLWKVGKKKGWWKGVRGGDVLVFVIGLGVLNAVTDYGREGSVDSGLVKRVMANLQGERELGMQVNNKEEGKQKKI
ncbi:MAG: hypothetical protein Q9227_007409 [Pyrenula ochraceoflavens]